MVIVDGTVEINEYTDRDGAKRTSVDIQCSNVELIEWKNDDERTDGGGSNDEPQQAAAKPAAAAPAATHLPRSDRRQRGARANA